MSNNKQSSIEFYRKELNALVSFSKTKFKTEQEIFEQAKAMHKEEMKQTYFDGWYRNTGNRDEDFENYYNETQGGNTNEQQ